MPKLSAIIICLNEETAIEECLRSVAFMDEIVVVDSGSTDRTLEICRRYTDKVVQHPWEGYGPQKNRALAAATGEWIFSIDCDERVTPELRASIERALAGKEGYVAYEVPRRNFFLGKWLRYGGWYPDRQLRLFRKDAGTFAHLLHERVVPNGPVGRLSGDLAHYTYNSLSDYIERQHRYATLRAEHAHAAGKRASLWRMPAKPFLKFLEVYLYKQGFRDGAEGLVVALLASCFALVRYAKLWELNRGAGSKASAHQGEG